MLCFTKLLKIGKAGLNESFKNPQRSLDTDSNYIQRYECSKLNTIDCILKEDL